MIVVAETTRRLADGREVVESRHLGHVVVVAPDGTVAAAGDPDRPTFYRSAVKPFQATASLELAGDVGLTDDEVAVGWASHRAEPEHLAAVRRICARIGLDPAALTTPPDVPLDDPCAEAAPIAHNCSGKHALFALAGHARGVRDAALLDPEGEVQRHVLAAVEAAVGVRVAVSVDGCGAPAARGPLAGLARGFQRLAAGGERWRRVVSAGTARPHLVGGTGRLETALLAAGVVAKPGAEAVFGAGWSDRDGAWGLAVKVEDGASRAAAAAVHALLAARGVIDPGAWRPPAVLGGGQPVGNVRAEPALAERSLQQAPLR